MAVLVLQENLQDEGGALAMRERETKGKGIHWERQGRKELRSEGEKNKASREKKKENPLVVEEGKRRRGSIRRASLILERDDRTGDRVAHTPTSVSPRSPLLPRDGREERRNTCSLSLVDMQGKFSKRRREDTCISSARNPEIDARGTTRDTTIITYR